MADPISPADSEKDLGTDARRWTMELEAYEKYSQNWRKSAEQVVREYNRAKTSEEESAIYQPMRNFNVLWSSIEIQSPAIFSRAPVPNIDRRWKDADPIPRLAAEVLERSVTTELELDDIKNILEQISFDYQTAGRGVPWVRIETIDGEELPPEDPAATDGEEAPLATDEAPLKEVVDQRAPVEYVHWKDFYHKPAKTWAELKRSGWVARRVLMTKDAGIERFDAKFKDVKLNHSPKEMRGAETGDEAIISTLKEAEVFEIWNAADKKVYWVVKGHDEILDTKDDPFGLRDFFPCPRPVATSLTNEGLLPTPDYKQYEALANELDELTERISIITKAIKIKGIYDVTMEGLATLLSDTADDTTMVGITNLTAYLAKGSTRNLQSVVQFLPIDMMAEVLIQLYNARQQTEDLLYKISGISDIVRGSVDPREKLGQSRIKGQFATLRLSKRQDEMARLARDVIRIKAELIAEHFPASVIREISGFDAIPDIVKLKKENPTAVDAIFNQVFDLLRSDKARGFKIEIETDSTVTVDEDASLQNRTEFVTSIGGLLEAALPAVQQQPKLFPLISCLVMFAVRSFKSSRGIEGEFQAVLDSLEDEAKQPQQPPPPDPRLLKVQADAKLGAAEIQRKAAKDQADHQIDVAKLASDHQTDTADIALRTADMIHGAAADRAMAAQPVADDTSATSSPAPAAPDQTVQMLMAMIGAQSQNMQAIVQSTQQLTQAVLAAVQAIAQPKQVVVARDAEGKVIGGTTAPARLQ